MRLATSISVSVAMTTCWAFWLDQHFSWYLDSWGGAQTRKLVLAVPQAGMFCHCVAKAHL